MDRSDHPEEGDLYFSDCSMTVHGVTLLVVMLNHGHIWRLLIRGRCKKKHKKKLTNVSLYVCMSAENSKMLVFVCFFMFFPIVAWEKKHKMLVFMEYVCM